MSTLGWGWPLNSRKAHVFSSGRSLCGGWLFMGSTDPITKVMVQTHERGPDDCAACHKKLVARFKPRKAAHSSGNPEEGGKSQ
jgi:hypothetical protein